MTVFDKEPFAPTLLSQTDVEQMWRALMQPLGWRARALWFVLVAADDRPLPRICEIAELPDEIDPDGHAAAAELWRELLDDLLPEGRVALLLVRPGGGGPNGIDREIADGLYTACRGAGVPLEPIHLATDDDIWALPADEVLGRAMRPGALS
ncbi:hypothetical protein P5P86_17235 [Nocardioides sp. BP30]|uniref:hypothetical protein n=1 Tax=Nocardioides sp. BP30 TaxID=3036374 RepID=UPI0024696674|nr:hypothetical protein [Nocardioides sp. BP30]WGL51689.1 hypothetical protein P5P86_17235 [Nocardioides sp. BP30]